MMIDKNKLKLDIEVMKEKLASMEQELVGYKHFPSKGDTYVFHYPSGHIDSCYAQDNRVRPYTYKTVEEAVKAYDKAVALEKIKRRLLELQGDWIPNWNDGDELKTNICYYHYSKVFEVEAVYFSQSFSVIPYMKNEEIASAIINEFHSELRLILNIA